MGLLTCFFLILENAKKPPQKTTKKPPQKTPKKQNGTKQKINTKDISTKTDIA